MSRRGSPSGSTLTTSCTSTANGTPDAMAGLLRVKPSDVKRLEAREQARKPTARKKRGK